MSLTTDDLKPFTEGESAIEWLARDMGGGTDVSRRAMYHLNIVNHFIQNETEIFKRLPSARLGGLPEGGRRHVAASVLLRAGEGPGGGAAESVQPSGYTVAQETLAHWAERDGCWHDYADSRQTAQGYRFLDSGSESKVYYDNKGYCHKNIDASHYGSLQRLLDRITLHNAVFPETAMTVEGFGLKDEATDCNDFVVMVRQPHVHGKAASYDEVIRRLRRMDFHVTGTRSSDDERGITPRLAEIVRLVSDDGIHLSDLNARNVVLSPEGRLMVFDCDVLVNGNAQLGPVFEIPARTFSEAAVAAIDAVIREVTPLERDRLAMEMACRGLHDQLRDKGRYEGTVTDPDTGLECLVELNPDDEDVVLLLPVESARLMASLTGDVEVSAEEQERVAHGETVCRARERIWFDVDKGRVASVREKIKRQSTAEKNAVAAEVTPKKR